MHVGAQIRKRWRFCDDGPSDADRILKCTFHDRSAYACEFVLDCAPRGHVTLKIRQSPHRTREDRFEKRFLAGKMRIDRWLAGRRPFGHLVDARTSEALAEK